VKYTTETPLPLFDPHQQAIHLAAVIHRAVPLLTALSDAETAKPRTDGQWSAKQILGHLIDSAGNNLQRIVRLQLQDSLSLPGYEQNGWVRIQHYEQRAWSEIIALWSALNRHLAHTIQHLDKEALAHTWHLEGEQITLAFLIEDYTAHLQHHLRQILPGWIMEEKS
jgi:DinB superfamily